MWPAGLGLPTADALCLSAYTYCRLAKCHIVTVLLTGNTDSLSGPLPQLRKGKTVVADSLDCVLGELRALGTNIDHKLSRQELADTLAFCSLIENSLLPAILYGQWLDKEYYDAKTCRWHSNVMRFPQSFILPRSLRQRATEAQLGRSIEEVMAGARVCLKALNARLCVVPDPQYFFGNTTSTLDAVVASHVAAATDLLVLKGDIELYPALTAHATRTLAAAGLTWPEPAPASAAAPKSFSERVAANSDLLFIVGVVGVMGAFAVYVGWGRD